jgi:type I restriction-modification system DNA methylase subunit
MNLFNRKILQNRIATFNFPTDGELKDKLAVVDKWQKSLKDSDLGKTKEKSVQGLFLQKFFNEILGYTDKASGESEYNLIAEPKTEVDAQKADGSLGFFNATEKTTKAILELKDAKTQLDKKQQGREKGYTPIEQAYLYATKFDRCDWIIVSNFREVRIYNKQRTQDYYEKFDVLELHQEDEFKRFYYLLYKSNLISKEGKSVIDELFEKTDKQQEDISKEFYNKFKEARLELFDHLVKHNPTIAKPLLFEKAQKILDRIIFILFSEDTGNLLPTGILKQAYELGLKSRDRSNERIWREVKNLFIDIDEGRSDIDPTINRYNGGLFAKDEVLDNLQIKDSIWQSVISLSSYDFESDLNVNILGHIFEQSISDIEEIKVKFINVYENINNGEISEEPANIKRLVEKEGKRKKEGIYYTPEYITKYIVENTVGRYLEEHPDKLQTIKILDPACGSGAFLNQAHSYLLGEYRNRFEQKVLERHEKQENLSIFDINVAENNRSILLNNLFGVDLNSESVEITKLSLWLKTARSSEPLQNLDKNIKSGNSLVDDPEVAGDKAFKWGEEYQDIIQDGGFDVIIGNPPYVKIQNLGLTNKEEDYFKAKFVSATNKYDIYVLFVEKAIELLKEGGYIGFIMPHKFVNSDFGVGLRRFLSENRFLSEITHFGSDMVFEDATTYTAIMIFQKVKHSKIDFRKAKPDSLSVMASSANEIDYSFLTERPWVLIPDKERSLLQKISSQHDTLGSLAKGINQGVVSTGDDIFMLSGRIDKGVFKGFSRELSREIEIEADLLRPVLKGKDIRRYEVPRHRLFLIYPHELVEGNTVPIEEHLLLEKYPKTYHYLEQFKDHLIEKKLKYKTNPKYWYSLHRARDLDIFDGPKIMTPQLQNRPNFTYIEDTQVCDAGGYIIKIKEDNVATYKALTGILNSNILWYFIKNTSNVFSNDYYYFKTKYLETFGIPALTSDKRSAISKMVVNIQDAVKKKLEVLVAAELLLEQEYGFTPTEDCFTGWNVLMDELKSQKISMGITQQEELQKWFRGKQKELDFIREEITNLEEEINQEVYKLYGLEKAEINIIENT